MKELDLFKLFLLSELSGKKRKRSLSTVTLHLQTLQRALDAVPDLDPEKLQLHLLSLFEMGRKGQYLNKTIDTLKIYGRFKGHTLYNSFKYFPIDDYEKAIMSDQEIEAFLALPPPITTRRSANGTIVSYPMAKGRWKLKTMLWKIMAYTGMRPGEIATLTIDTVDFGRRVFLADGKTGKRLVPIPDHLTAELTAYVSQLTTDRLFPTVKGVAGGVIKDNVWGQDFHERIKRMGIKRNNLTPYSLRHSFISRMLDEGVQLYPLQNLVGHKQGSPVTAQYYHLGSKSLIKLISKDPLSRQHLSYNERFMQFRNNVRQLLSDYASDTTEEMQMVKDLSSKLF